MRIFPSAVIRNRLQFAAERLRDRIDETHAADAVGKLVVHRRLAWIIALRRNQRAELRFEYLSNFFARKNLLGCFPRQVA